MFKMKFVLYLMATLSLTPAFADSRTPMSSPMPWLSAPHNPVIDNIKNNSVWRGGNTEAAIAKRLQNIKDFHKRYNVYDELNQNYLGAVTLIDNGIFIASAHVIDKMSKNSFESLLQNLSIEKNNLKLYQFKFKNKFLDAVILADAELTNSETIKLSLAKNSAEQYTSGQEFSTVYITHFDNNLIEQNSSGVLSVSQDRNLLYLNEGQNIQLNWGSSGSLVFSKNTATHWKLAGIIQCVVLNKTATAQGSVNSTYFRALSTQLLIFSELIPITFDHLKLSETKAQYNLENCGPVDAKNGGGG